MQRPLVIKEKRLRVVVIIEAPCELMAGVINDAASEGIIHHGQLTYGASKSSGARHRSPPTAAECVTFDDSIAPASNRIIKPAYVSTLPSD